MNKRCILLGTFIAFVLVILNTILNHNVPQEPEVPFNLWATCPVVDVHQMEFVWVEFDEVQDTKLTLRRHINNGVYACNKNKQCWRIKQ